jgi:hypothetical protein
MKFRTDALRRVLVASWVEDDDPFWNQERRQWDVGRDGDIAGDCVLRDIAVGHIRPAIDAHGRHVRVTWGKRKAHVCNQNGRERETLGRAVADLLHGQWSGVGVDPECHDHELSMAVGEETGCVPGWRKIIVGAIVGTPWHVLSK